MVKELQVIKRQFELSTRLFRNVLKDVKQEEGAHRLNGRGNHLQWIAGHLISIRHRNAQRFAKEMAPYAHNDKFVIPDMPPPNARPLDENISYPELSELLQDWDKCSAALLEALDGITAEQLSTEGTFSTPLGGKTLLDMLAFIAYHEAFHIGQMSMLRRSLGHQAMSFRD